MSEVQHPPQPSSRFLHLAPQEHHPERAFTHPAHSLQDLRQLTEIRDRLLETLGRQQDFEEHLEENRWSHSVHVFDPIRLQRVTPLAFVGFRSILKPHTPQEIREELTRIDAHLVAELRADPQPAILSYSSRQLDAHNWLNLVVLKDLSSIGYWQHSAHHHRASQHLSPQSYQGIRLHHGVLQGGIQGTLLLHTTKYYDFSAGGPWFAQRTLTALNSLS